MQAIDLVKRHQKGERDFRGADLRGAVLRSVDLSGADLSGADLSGADLSGAVLSGAYLSGAYLRGAYLRGEKLLGSIELLGCCERGYKLVIAPTESGIVVVCGCRTWRDLRVAIGHYGSGGYPHPGRGAWRVRQLRASDAYQLAVALGATEN